MLSELLIAKARGCNRSRHRKDLRPKWFQFLNPLIRHKTSHFG